MAKLGFDARSHAPKASEDRLPALYSKLGTARRRAVRERYEELQGGRCYHCKRSLDGPAAPEILAKPLQMGRFPVGFFDHRCHLHHDHKTDLTIGAVHPYCNAVLWQYHGE